MIKKFENFDYNDLIWYEIRYWDSELGDDITVPIDDEDVENEQINFGDLKDMVKLLCKYEERTGENVFLVKIKENLIDKRVVDKIKLEIEAEKYNL